MQASAQLKELLHSINRKSYPAYKSLRGAYQFDRYILSIDHVQGDPFASPSHISVKLSHRDTGFPAEYYKDSLILLLKDDRNKKIHKIMTKRDEWPEDIQQSVRQIIKESIERERLMVEKFISKGQEEGRFRENISPTAVAVLISSIFHGLCVMQLSGMLPEEFPQYTDILFDAFTKELSAK